MSAYQPFASTRTAEPDPSSLLASLRAQDSSAGVQHDPGSGVWVVKKATEWTVNQIAFVQNVINTAPAVSMELSAQSTIDQWPIELRALVLALIDQLNVIRRALPVPLSDISPAQALAAIRAKAGTL